MKINFHSNWVVSGISEQSSSKAHSIKFQPSISHKNKPNTSATILFSVSKKRTNDNETQKILSRFPSYMLVNIKLKHVSAIWIK